MQNTIKDDIKNALERAGYRTNIHNIEFLYQVKDGSSYSALIKEYAAYLKK
jgi:hypothetical protein